jgi:hypothetical protein
MYLQEEWGVLGMEVGNLLVRLMSLRIGVFRVKGLLSRCIGVV